MADAITDAMVVRALRPFVRGARPVLDGLRESDPFGLRARVVDASADRTLVARVLDTLTAVEVPGTAAWAAMDPSARSRWWVRRVGRFTTLLASVPGIGGALAKRLPVSGALGAAGQGLLLVAIAREHGVRDEDEIVELLAAVMFRRELDLRRVPLAASTADAADADERAAELTGELTAPGARPTLARVGGAVWRMGRALLAVEDELDRRPHGNLLHQGLGALPAVGVVGTYLGEWSGLKRAAREAERRLEQRRGDRGREDQGRDQGAGGTR